MADVKFYQGKKSEMPGASTPGRLLFTVDAEPQGKPEGHIYYDNGSELIELYKEDFAAIKELIGDTAVTQRLEALYKSSKTIGKEETGLEVKVSTSQEPNLLKSGDDGLYVAPIEQKDYTVKLIPEGEPTEGSAKTYTLKQGAEGQEVEIGKIDIPKDMVVSDADVEKIADYKPEGEDRPGVTANGTYLVLTISNAESKKLYVLMDQFFDVYEGSAGTDIKVTVTGKQISATLNDNGIATAKIQNEAVTEEKLSAEVKAKLEPMAWGTFAEIAD